MIGDWRDAEQAIRGMSPGERRVLLGEAITPALVSHLHDCTSWPPDQDPRIWRTLEGTLIPISEMTVEHMMNVLQHFYYRAQSKKFQKCAEMMLGIHTMPPEKQEETYSAVRALAETEPFAFLRTHCEPRVATLLNRAEGLGLIGAVVDRCQETW